MSQDLLNDLAGLADAAGATVYVVGGYLRDLLLEREPVDLDLLVEGNPAPFLVALSRRAGFDPVVFSRREPITYRIAMGDWLIDISACEPGGLHEAMARRDFTINALAAPLRGPGSRGSRESLAPIDRPIDLLGGLADLRARRIVHISEAGLDDDPVRLLRAVRLSVVLEGFSIDPGLREGIRKRAQQVLTAPVERIRAEMEVILACPRAGAGLRMMLDTGLLFAVFPSLSPLAGLTQNHWHRYDALEHTLRTVEESDALQRSVPVLGVQERLGVEDAETLKFAALFHDAGKPATAQKDDSGAIHFYGHEAVSAEIAVRALSSLRLGAAKVDRIRILVANHLRLSLMSASGPVSDKALRRLVHQLKYDTPLLCLLAIADRRAGGGPDFESRLARLEALVSQVMTLFLAEGPEVISPPPLVTGDEVMEMLGIPPGPPVGSVMRWLTRLQVEGRAATRAEAMAAVRSLSASRILTLDDEA